MSLTRRELMYATTMAAGTALLPPRLRASSEAPPVGIVISPQDDNCLARESAAGYERVLRGRSDAPVVIVPAISTLSPTTARDLREKAQAGYSIVLESAFFFADENLAESPCQIVRAVFGLPVESDHEGAENDTSYLQYHWPANVLVRAFGRPTYLREGDHHPIAHQLGNRIVAARKSIGRGQLTFLGSPLGPLLLAEDREATLLVQRMVAESA